MSWIYAIFPDSLTLYNAMELLKQKGFHMDSIYIYSREKHGIDIILSKLHKNENVKKQYEKFLVNGSKVLSIKTGIIRIWKARKLLKKANGKEIVKKIF